MRNKDTKMHQRKYYNKMPGAGKNLQYSIFMV